MAIIWRTRDRLGRVVVLTAARREHILRKHPELLGRLETVRAVLEDPEVVTADAQYPHREIQYRRIGTGRLYLKVVVHYRPVPPQGTWQGEVITAHPIGEINRKELRIWP